MKSIAYDMALLNTTHSTLLSLLYYFSNFTDISTTSYKPVER